MTNDAYVRLLIVFISTCGAIAAVSVVVAVVLHRRMEQRPDESVMTWTKSILWSLAVTVVTTATALAIAGALGLLSP